MTTLLNNYPYWSQDRKSRYADNWVESFRATFEGHLRPGMSILDVGSGRRPLLEPQYRPANTHYVGLDISEDELRKAPDESYDEFYIQNICSPQERAAESFDLIVSWQVLEHVTSVSSAIDNCYHYLKPGGVFASLLTGGNAFFSRLNQLLPESLSRATMEHLLGRIPDTVFSAHYDSCTASDLQPLFDNWEEVAIIPRFRGAGYLNFAKPVAASYLLYEDWAARTGKLNLATHYFVIARK